MGYFDNKTSYAFEIWGNNGVALADISAIAKNRNYTIKRNDAEELAFDIDLFKWEAFCASAGLHPRATLQPDQVDVKVKRNGEYLLGTHLKAAPINIGTDYTMSVGSGGGGAGTFNPTISCKCTGYLNLFADRYITASFTNQERVSVAGQLITATQAITYGSFGVTLAGGQANTGVTDIARSYQNSNIKDALQNLARLPDGKFDFAFGYDKRFYTYSQIGSARTDLAFAYGGPASNIIGLYDENSATGLYNQVIAIGSGNGQDALTSTRTDPTSALNNFLRQKVFQHPSDSYQDTLDKNAAADLAESKLALNLPQITISGKELEGVPFLSVGDRIPLSFVGHPYLAPLNGTYRIEQFTVDLDDNDFEQSIRIYFDNFDLAA